jgi:hypothetical protein
MATLCNAELVISRRLGGRVYLPKFLSGYRLTLQFNMSFDRDSVVFEYNTFYVLMSFGCKFGGSHVEEVLKKEIL